jgi:trans-aconitate methyltransferase
VTDEARIAAYYDKLVDTYGDDPRAVDASSERSLRVRYETLAAVADLRGKTVLEVGCGLGGLGVFLTERFDGLTYRGIDISQRMVEEAKRLHPGLAVSRANVLDLGPADAADVVLAQGIFYLLGENAEEKMQTMLERMFALAREAVAFTTMSSWAPAQDATEFFADPERLLRFCRGLSPRLVLRHDYHDADVALYLYKEPVAPTP